MEAWKSYLNADPAPANKLIQADNPNMRDGQIAFGIKRLNELQNLIVIFVTHSVYESVFLSTRIVVMGSRPGRVTADIPIEVS
jgi:ABC-type molybdate transport system ATPase subunit